uniref:Uncharacterized protein n=1 Tax=Anguilla anguilla TaxID=7936 RepID=A0A0E9SEM0_ANGAN
MNNQTLFPFYFINSIRFKTGVTRSAGRPCQIDADKIAERLDSTLQGI